jgi:hypothetical protein
MDINPNRIAVYLTAAAALCTAVAVPVAQLDTTSTIGVVGSLAAIVAVVDRWLKGWQQYETQQWVGTQGEFIEDYAEPVIADGGDEIPVSL